MINNEIGERWRNERRVLEKFQGGFDDGVLTRRVVRPVERITVPERHEQRARRTHALGHFAKELNCHGRNAAAFEFGGDQTHGLVAYRSDGHQQCDVHRVFDQPPRGFGRRLPDQSSGRGYRTHERQVPPIDRADAAAFGQFARAVDGESEVWVPKDTGVIE